MTCRAYDGAVISHKRHRRIQLSETVYDQCKHDTTAHQYRCENRDGTEAQRRHVVGSFENALGIVGFDVCKKDTLRYKIMEQC